MSTPPKLASTETEAPSPIDADITQRTCRIRFRDGGQVKVLTFIPDATGGRFFVRPLRGRKKTEVEVPKAKVEEVLCGQLSLL